jgi:hypothetical protein
MRAGWATDPMFGRCEKMARMDSPEPAETATTDEQRPATRGPPRIRYGATRTRELIRIAYRDPQHISERLSLFAAQRLAEPSREWAHAARRARPHAEPAELAEWVSAIGALVARDRGYGRRKSAARRR